MEITKEVLEDRIAGMMQQLGPLLEQTSQLQGAISVCKMLIEYLESAEPEEEEHSATA